MSKDLALLIAKLSELRGRAAEINRRIQRDALLLTAVQQELSDAVSSLAVVEQTVRAHLPTAPRSPSVLRLVEVSKRIGLSRSMVWQMAKDGHFPSPRRLSDRAVGWLDTEVTEWLNSREVTPAQRVVNPKRRRE